MKRLTCRIADFPILADSNAEQSLIYLDSGATTQKPAQVIDTLNEYYRQDNANIHRAVYALGERATERYENAREVIAQFINTQSSNEIIFTRGATEAINLVAEADLCGGPAFFGVNSGPARGGGCFWAGELCGGGVGGGDF